MNRQAKKFSDNRTEYSDESVLPIIKPKLTKKDIKLMSEKPIETIETQLIPCAMAFCKGKTDFRLVMELVNGNIVTNIDAEETAALPDLSKLTINELKVLKECYHLKEFTPEDIKEPSVVRVEAYVQMLASKGYLISKGNKYVLNPGIILNELSNYANYDSISLVKMSFDTKLKPRLSLDAARERLSNFVKVEEMRECYLVHFKVTQRIV